MILEKDLIDFCEENNFVMIRKKSSIDLVNSVNDARFTLVKAKYGYRYKNTFVDENVLNSFKVPTIDYNSDIYKSAICKLSEITQNDFETVMMFAESFGIKIIELKTVIKLLTHYNFSLLKYKQAKYSVKYKSWSHFRSNVEPILIGKSHPNMTISFKVLRNAIDFIYEYNLFNFIKVI